MKTLISVAPMMDWTDRHCRFFLRLIAPHVLLYTEMVTTGAILMGDKHRYLAFNLEEHPLALQLGGSDPKALAECAKIAEDYGYDEVNLNIGCPSDRVQNGRFGACLMAEPELVAESVAAMQEAVNIPITIKTRIGIDDLDSYVFLENFVKLVSQAGCETFIIHARKAWLKGLSPKQNREVPELNYPRVYAVKQAFPGLNIHINGGVNSIVGIEEHLQQIDGVMIGREAYQNPYFLADVEKTFFDYISPSRSEVLEALLPYVQKQLLSGMKLSNITRHVLGLFQGLPGARAYRRHLSTHGPKAEADTSVIEEAIAFVA